MPKLADWAVRPLRDVLLSARVGFAGRPTRNGGGVDHVRPQNISTGGWLVLDDLKIVDAGDRDLDMFSLRRGDILFNNTNSPTQVGKSCLVLEERDAAFSNHITRLRLDHTLVSPSFVAEWLRYLYLSGYFRHSARQWVQQAAINLDALARLPLPYPAESASQNGIAEAGRVARDAVRAADEASLTAREVVQQWFDANLPGMLGSRHTSRLLSDIADVTGGLSVSPSRSAIAGPSVPYLRVANVYRSELALEDVKSMQVTPRELEAKLLRSQDLLMVEGHGDPDQVGRVAMWDGSLDQCVHQNHIYRLRVTDSSVRPAYLLQLLNSRLLRERIRRTVRTTSGLNSLRISEVRTLTVPLVPVDRQEAVEAVVGESDNLRRQLTAQRLALAELERTVVLTLFAPARAALSALSGWESASEVRAISVPDSAKNFPTLWAALPEHQQRVWAVAASFLRPFAGDEILAAIGGGSSTRDAWSVGETLEMLEALGFLQRAMRPGELSWRFVPDARSEDLSESA
jgi:type I restriction enzyme S subunit